MESRKLVVGEFGDSFYPVMDGVANVVKNYTEQMIRLGHTAYAVVPGYKDSEEYDEKHGLDYVIRGRNYSPIQALKPYGFVMYPRDVANIPFDIVHSHSPIFAGAETLKISKAKHIPVVSTFHTFFRDDLKELIRNPKVDDFIIKNRMKYYSKIDEMWTPSQGAKKKIENEYYFNGFIRVVENGCDMKIPTHEQYEEYRRKGFEAAGLDYGSKFFIYVGQHKDQKNIQLILDSMKVLVSRGEDCHMVFVGDGHRKEAYERWVRENGLEGRVRFLGRISEREVLCWLYSAAYLFLFPSLYDTSCLVMREAAAFGLPLVYIEGACTSEGRTDGEDGFLAKNNTSDFSDKLASVLHNPALRNAAGAGAKARIYRSWDDVGKEVQSLYMEIIDRKKSGKTPRRRIFL